MCEVEDAGASPGNSSLLFLTFWIDLGILLKSDKVYPKEKQGGFLLCPVRLRRPLKFSTAWFLIRMTAVLESASGLQG